MGLLNGEKVSKWHPTKLALIYIIMAT